MKKELSFIIVIGKDKKGIVAKISNLLYNNNINIEDINQKIMEGLFVMTMLVDISGYKYPMNKLKSSLEKIGKEMGLKIQIQHENIFKMMHRV
jgi:predicted amino acid-binding ACT domain protein